MALKLLFLRQKPNDCRLIYRNGLFTAKITSTYSKFLSLTDSDRFNAEQTPKIPSTYSKFLSLIDFDRFNTEQTPSLIHGRTPLKALAKMNQPKLTLVRSRPLPLYLTQ